MNLLVLDKLMRWGGKCSVSAVSQIKSIFFKSLAELM